jgi:transposase
MKLAVGIDVHKAFCVAHATGGSAIKVKPKQQYFIDRFNSQFERFPSDSRGMYNLCQFLKGHEVHILIENSTKSHDIYWMLRGMGMDVTVAHATDLRNITKSMRKNDDNDARELAHYMRRRLLGENEFHESYIPDRDVLIRRELCRSDLNDRTELTKVKLQIRSHLLIRGMDLSKEYSDVTSLGAKDELRRTKDVVILLDVKKADTLQERILFTEKLLRHMFLDDPVFETVYSIPGFGILSAAYVACMGDDFSRFPDGRTYAASVGLIPKQDESADIGKNCGITRRGDAELRRLVCQATFVHVVRTDSFISQKYRRLKAAGKNHNEALVACANSMCRMVWKMVVSGRKYIEDPELLAQARSYVSSGEVELDMEAAAIKG